MKTDNPFYSNHLFSRQDLYRDPLRWRTKIRLLTHPMLCQTRDGYTFHFKIDNRGAYYLFRTERED